MSNKMLTTHFPMDLEHTCAHWRVGIEEARETLDGLEPTRKGKRKADFRRKMVQGGEDSDKDEFTSLTEIKPIHKKMVARVLPRWMLHPVFVDRNLSENKRPLVESCPILHPKLLKMLEEKNIQYLFPIQQKIIPQILKNTNGADYRVRPRDICVTTPTGSGKTLAFVLPIVQSISQSSNTSIQALIVLPVAELAEQVYRVFLTYAAPLSIRVGTAFGSESITEEQKKLVQPVCGGYASRVHIVVGTPGRLIDHITKSPGFDLYNLRYLVFDEADKLMVGENGQIISRIQECVNRTKPPKSLLVSPPFFPLGGDTREENSVIGETEEDSDLGPQSSPYDRLFREPLIRNRISQHDHGEVQSEYFNVFTPPAQKLLFSATLSRNPELLQNVALNLPVLFTSAQPSAISEESNLAASDGDLIPMRPSELVEEYLLVDVSVKPLSLHCFLEKEIKLNPKLKVLVFAGSIELTSKLALILKCFTLRSYTVQEFSSKVRDRTKVLKRFVNGTTNVLVSSDAMARGMDVFGVDCVVSYDVPSKQTYIHRVGRTARAGKSGKAVSLVAGKEMKFLKKLLGSSFEDVSPTKIEEENLNAMKDDYKIVLDKYNEILENKSSEISKSLKKKKLLKSKLK